MDTSKSSEDILTKESLEEQIKEARKDFYKLNTSKDIRTEVRKILAVGPNGESKVDSILQVFKEWGKDIAFSLVEPCNPDCTPVEHAYHQGTWDAHWKLTKIFEGLEKEV
jgi:hypothetical protein